MPSAVRASLPVARRVSLVSLLAFVVASIAIAATTSGALAASAVEAAMAREQRVALVVGNGRYASSPLANPVNDARAMSAALKSMGFRVMLVEDASIAQMADAVRGFGEALKPGGVGLFFYAGHGMQIKGHNYLIPVNADIQREDEVAFNAYDAAQVLEKMEAAKSRVNIVILDACRNNPFTRSFRSSSQGLATMDAPFGSYVAMATAPGRVAGDGSDGNGVYTKNLLVAMKTPGIPIEDVFKRTRVKVMTATDSQQVPWDYSSLSGNFYFVPAEGSAAVQTVDADALTAPTTGARTSPPTRLASAPQSAAQSSVKPSAPASASATPASASATPSSAMAPSAAYDQAMQLKIGRKPVQQDLPRALKLFVEAANKGHTVAQYEAARAYADGIGTAKSCRDAIAWAQKAARAGSIEGAVLAGDLQRADCNGSRNLAESAKWYRVAADKGVPAAQFALGVLYLNGDGVTKDVAQARKWLTAAADKGNASARFYLDRLPH